MLFAFSFFGHPEASLQVMPINDLGSAKLVVTTPQGPFSANIGTIVAKEGRFVGIFASGPRICESNENLVPD